MAIMLKSGVALLLLGILLIPCAARLSHNNGQYILEPLRKVSEWSNKVQSTDKADFYSKVQGVWNASWPTFVKLKLESVVKHGFPESADQLYSLSKPCRDDLRRLLYGVSVMDGWALKMLDAIGKLPSGLMLGNMHWPGMYGECLDISSKESQTQQLNNSTVLGKHCLMTIGETSMPLGIEFGICIPRTCNSTDAMALINQVLIEVTDEIRATDADCSDNSSLPLDSGAVVVITILCVLGALILLGTGLDVIRNHWHQQIAVDEHTEDAKIDDNEELPLTNGVVPVNQNNVVFPGLKNDDCLYRFLISFSALANAKKVLSLQPQQASGDLDALNGIRFLSMSWIIVGHTYMFAIPIVSNIGDYFDWIKGFLFQPLINGTVAVDTFFVLSGTLSSYSLLKDVQAKGGLRNISWPYFYFHRFWRLSPLYFLLLGIWATLFRYFGSGPFWPEVSDANCYTSWWTNLLYINNIVNQDSMCMGWTWYLANDMQFFLLLPIFVALLYKSALLGGIVIFVFMLASSITTGVLTYVNDYPPATPGILQNFTSAPQWFKAVYFVPWCRINTYLVGILLGYILYKYSCKLKIHRALVVLGWCLAAVCNLSVLYGLYDVANGHYLSPSINALYASVHRLAWGVGVAWVILACATGNGGFVNDLLSLPIMQPLSRLTYAAYLVQQMVIPWYYQNLKVPLFLNHITAVYLFFAHLVLSYICSFVCSVLIENPMINLERSFLRNRKNQD